MPFALAGGLYPEKTEIIYRRKTTISYLVCTLKKINNKDRDNVTPIERENERDESYVPDNPNIDLSRTKQNYHTVIRMSSYMDYINERIATLPLKRKVRCDAVLMGAFIIGSDGAFFSQLSPSEQRQFFEDATGYFAERYGEENIISAVVHMDETTPHMHLNLIPITEDRLSAKRLFTRKSLRELQTDFWEKVGKKWNLERGKPGSQATHKSVAEYKAQKILEAAKAEADEKKAKAQEYLDEVIKAVEQEKAKPTPKRRKQAEEEITALRTENAALRQSLDIRNKDTADLFSQLQKAQRVDKTKDTAFRMVSDMLDAYPDEFDALLHKSRAKKSAPYSFKPKSSGNDRSGK